MHPLLYCSNLGWSKFTPLSRSQNLPLNPSINSWMSWIGKLLVFALPRMLQHKILPLNVQLQAKQFLREFYHLCKVRRGEASLRQTLRKSFLAVKRLFELVTHHQIFDFPKVFMYGAFMNYLGLLQN